MHSKRARLIAELEANPAVKANLFRLAKAEWGTGGPAQIQAGIESILNRAAMRGETVAQAIGPGYHSPSRGRGGVGGLPSPKDVTAYEAGLKAAAGGSNLADYSTGNFAFAGRGYGGRGGYGTKLIGTEQFSVQAADAAKIAAVKAADEAARKQAGPTKEAARALPPTETVKKAEAVAQSATKILKSGSTRDPFGVQLLHPSFQPKPAPPPKALNFSMMEDAMMKDPRRIGLNRMIRDMNLQQRVSGATGGQNVAVSPTINVNGVAPGREALMAKKTMLALRDPIAEGLRQLRAMRAEDMRTGYV